MPGKRPFGPGVFSESAKSSVWATVRVAICLSSVGGRNHGVSGRITVTRKMLTLFVVDDLTLVVLRHRLRIDTRIADVAMDRRIFRTLVCDSLQESGAARARAPKNQTHFSRLQKAGLPARVKFSQRSDGDKDSDIRVQNCRQWHLWLDGGDDGLD